MYTSNNMNHNPQHQPNPNHYYSHIYTNPNNSSTNNNNNDNRTDYTQFLWNPPHGTGDTVSKNTNYTNNDVDSLSSSVDLNCGSSVDTPKISNVEKKQPLTQQPQMMGPLSRHLLRTTTPHLPKNTTTTTNNVNTTANEFLRAPQPRNEEEEDVDETTKPSTRKETQNAMYSSREHFSDEENCRLPQETNLNNNLHATGNTYNLQESNNGITNNNNTAIHESSIFDNPHVVAELQSSSAPSSPIPVPELSAIVPWENVDTGSERKPILIIDTEEEEHSHDIGCSSSSFSSASTTPIRNTYTTSNNDILNDCFDNPTTNDDNNFWSLQHVSTHSSIDKNTRTTMTIKEVDEDEEEIDTAFAYPAIVSSSSSDVEQGTNAGTSDSGYCCRNYDQQQTNTKEPQQTNFDFLDMVPSNSGSVSSICPSIMVDNGGFHRVISHDGNDHSLPKEMSSSLLLPTTFTTAASTITVENDKRNEYPEDNNSLLVLYSNQRVLASSSSASSAAALIVTNNDQTISSSSSSSSSSFLLLRELGTTDKPRINFYGDNSKEDDYASTNDNVRSIYNRRNTEARRCRLLLLVVVMIFMGSAIAIIFYVIQKNDDNNPSLSRPSDIVSTTTTNLPPTDGHTIIGSITNNSNTTATNLIPLTTNTTATIANGTEIPTLTTTTTISPATTAPSVAAPVAIHDELKPTLQPTIIMTNKPSMNFFAKEEEEDDEDIPVLQQTTVEEALYPELLPASTLAAASTMQLNSNNTISPTVSTPPLTAAVVDPIASPTFAPTIAAAATEAATTIQWTQTGQDILVPISGETPLRDASFAISEDGNILLIASSLSLQVYFIEKDNRSGYKNTEEIPTSQWKPMGNISDVINKEEDSSLEQIVSIASSQDGLTLVIAFSGNVVRAFEYIHSSHLWKQKGSNDVPIFQHLGVEKNNRRGKEDDRRSTISSISLSGDGNALASIIITSDRRSLYYDIGVCIYNSVSNVWEQNIVPIRRNGNYRKVTTQISLDGSILAVGSEIISNKKRSTIEILRFEKDTMTWSPYSGGRYLCGIDDSPMEYSLSGDGHLVAIATKDWSRVFNIDDKEDQPSCSPVEGSSNNNSNNFHGGSVVSLVSSPNNNGYYMAIGNDYKSSSQTSSSSSFNPSLVGSIANVFYFLHAGDNNSNGLSNNHYYDWYQVGDGTSSSVEDIMGSQLAIAISGNGMRLGIATAASLNKNNNNAMRVQIFEQQMKQ